MYGIYLTDSKDSSADSNTVSGGHLIEKMTIRNCLFRGIRIEGAHNIVKNCFINNTGGTQLFANSFAIGIEAIGPGVIIENNTVTETYACGKGESVGISLVIIAVCRSKL
ncbi:right-handed parallel beta-helix repeat-containing protein [Legionella clemsonensis]|uniref:Right handed beta helix domain-containing protein n=1 Tax=Legionella clemsonensis TaxID=1867846 RepID=A0A222P3M3_9GAMM|nr:right-handed parallel beta-helix repeat-containing protein [Legionella clemsonensis]ASQ46448.1 hypothetical protein clem_09490 [Legionella clemsonensis]